MLLTPAMSLAPLQRKHCLLLQFLPLMIGPSDIQTREGRFIGFRGHTRNIQTIADIAGLFKTINIIYIFFNMQCLLSLVHVHI